MLSLICSSLRHPQRVLLTELGLARFQHLGVIPGRRFKSFVSPTVEDSTIEERLRAHFNKVMKNANVPLFKSFDAYKKSLPVRVQSGSNKVLPLYTLPYWACEDDITFFVDRLENESFTDRVVVKYLAAPGGSGKTSAILPAFLRSAERGGFTHYIYLPFDNNYSRFYHCFDGYEKIRQALAINQGASFIFSCLKHLFEESSGTTGTCMFPCEEHPLEHLETENRLNNYLRDKIGPNYRILFHLDEHRKMCHREVNSEGDIAKGALFNRGAMQTLARIPNVTVVATYIKRPYLPPRGSSSVCRYPVPLPNLDMHLVMKNFPELEFPQEKLDSFNADEKRLWSTLCFRLGMWLTVNGISQLHQRGKCSIPSDEHMQLLKQFNQEKGHTNKTKALKNCIDLCRIKVGTYLDNNPNAIRLLMGFLDSEYDNIVRQVDDVVVIPGERISSGLRKLLTMTDPNFPVYDSGHNLFTRQLTSVDHDLLAHTPLQAAYYWTVSCESSLNGKIQFIEGANAFFIKCKQLKAGRLFRGDNSSIYDKSFSDLKRDVMYYADEDHNGLATHPLADIFFCTTQNELVLVDITGGQNAEIKKDKLANWIDQQQGNVTDFELHGVVLAPLISGHSKVHGRVQVVCGEDAQRLLGGLVQVLRWFK